MKEIEITFMGIPLRVEGIYIPEEQMVMYYPDGSGYPGSASNFDVNGVYAVDSEIDIFEIFSDDRKETIRDLVIEKIEE